MYSELLEHVLCPMIPAKLGTHDLHLTNCVFTQYSPHSLHSIRHIHCVDHMYMKATYVTWVFLALL